MPDLFDARHRAELLRRIDTLAPDVPGRWGRMNVHQAVCHMADAFRMSSGDRPLPDQSNLLLRTVIRFVALHTPLPWPKGSPTAPGLNQQREGTPPGDFARDVAALKALVEAFAATGGKGLHPHIAFGALSPREWGRWAWRHTDHHLRQFGA